MEEKTMINIQIPHGVDALQCEATTPVFINVADENSALADRRTGIEIDDSMNKSPKEEQVAPEEKFNEVVNSLSHRSDGETIDLEGTEEIGDDLPLPPASQFPKPRYADSSCSPEVELLDGYTPMRAELILLAEYWYKRWHDFNWGLFLYAYTETCFTGDQSCMAFAMGRIRQMEKVLGAEAIAQVEAAVESDFKANVDPVLWDAYEKGDWTGEKADRAWAEAFKRKEMDTLKSCELSLELLEKQSPGALIVLVLGIPYPGRVNGSVLLSPPDSELTAALGASGKLTIETDKSKLRELIVDRSLRGRGFLRATRQNGDWHFEFLDSLPVTMRWHDLKEVTDVIEKVQPFDTEEEF